MADIEQFREMLDALPEEERVAMLEALVTDYSGAETRIEDEMGRANDYRSAEDPRMRRAGRLSVASSPLEFLGTAAQRGVGEHLFGQAQQERKDLSTRRQDALGQVMSSLGGWGTSPALGRQTAAAGALRALERGR